MGKRHELIADNIKYNEHFARFARAYMRLPEAKEISQILNAPTAKIERETFTYRRITHWTLEGLIDEKREEQSKWRKFSIMDGLWLHILDGSRKWGISLDQLRNIKRSLSQNSKETSKGMPVLEYCAVLAIAHRIPITLVIFTDGSCAPITYADYKLNLMLGLEDHLSVNINRIVQRFYPDADLAPLYLADFNLTIEQLELLDFIESGKYEEINVFYRNGRIERFDGIEGIVKSTRLAEIMKEEKYQRIVMDIADGKVVSIERRAKRKPQND